MTKNNLNPHDRFFRKMLADKNVVQEFFTFHLPDKIKKNIDFSSIKLKKDSYISDNLREKIVDLLFQANFNNVIGYIYLLIEHQSQPEKFMPFRILKYMMAIMEDHLHSTKDSTLPIIYPMIFYSGDRSYNYSTDLFDLFSDRNLAREILYQPYQLINIHQIPHKQLERFYTMELCHK